MEEKDSFVEHLKSMASMCYGFTGAEIMTVASKYAVYLGKRTKDNPVTAYDKSKSSVEGTSTINN